MNRNRLRSRLQEHEGLRLTPYEDTLGNWTIGYGRNLTGVGIPLETAEAWLDADLDDATTDARRLDIFPTLNSARQEVIVEMIFNMGYSKFLGFEKMLAALESRDYHKAAVEMLDSRWARQVGTRAVVLADQMEQGRCRIQKDS